MRLFTKVSSKSNGEKECCSEEYPRDTVRTRMTMEAIAHMDRRDEELVVLRDYKDRNEERLLKLLLICDEHNECHCAREIKRLMLM